MMMALAGLGRFPGSNHSTSLLFSVGSLAFCHAEPILLIVLFCCGVLLTAAGIRVLKKG